MRFRLRTLLIATFLAALVCLALRAPTRGWSAGLFAALVVVTLTAVLAAIYRTGQTRAMAIGFCIFSFGYLLVEGKMWPGSNSALSLPTNELIAWSFDKLHSNDKQPSGGSSGQFAADDPFASILPPPKLQPYRGICIATLAAIFGLFGAGIAQQLERTRNSERASR